MIPRLLAAAALLAGVAVWIWSDKGGESWGRIDVRTSLEDRLADGSLHTPSTQSFLRGNHWLESVTEAAIKLDGEDLGSVEFLDPSTEAEVRVVSLPMDQLVPRLHYVPPSPPDAFDAFNLMLAEYSRNSLSVPVGAEGDTMAHFETTLTEERPWTLAADYAFVPNPFFRPVRIGVINNCLGPGLWELSATDRSGEIYHAWIHVPEEPYVRLIARTNGVDEAFVRDALRWRTDSVPLDLGRLRTVVDTLGEAPACLCMGEGSGYSTQDSRRKLARGYAHVNGRPPETLDELTTHPVQLASFVEPGKYSATERKRFDLQFLRGVRGARVLRTTAKTAYQPRDGVEARASLEIEIDLGEWRLVLGNLPPQLLVPQQDFAIHGFGVGVMSSGGLAERRRFLVDAGPAPTFAYLCRGDMAVNSHGYGLEQVFVRTHTNDAKPWWEITLTSYERIVDVVKYRVEIPTALHAELRNRAANYAAPPYRTYRDDNLR